ncbi:MAG TPA: CHAT domain-containing protein, partial [Erythrobacter sp.]|nr:CHAT domain-containing protein [Erythrobacter sp.]
AAEFFSAIVAQSGDRGSSLAEALANQGLQLSNLGDFNTALRLFDQAEASLSTSDRVGQRLLRNYRALDYLNQNDPDLALEILNQSILPITRGGDVEGLRAGVISDSIATRINRESEEYKKLGGVDPGLTPEELAAVLDAQGSAIRGSALRRTGEFAAAEEALSEAINVILSVREGHLHSATFMIAEIQIERAQIAEELGQTANSGAAYDAAIFVAADSFPRSPILLATEARKAAFLARSGQTDAARQLFADVVNNSRLIEGSGPAVRDLLQPYFDMLAADGSNQSAAEMFEAAQVLERPGLAQTQAVLARRFSEGDDEAASLFRLATVRSRAIARAQAEISKLSSLAEPTEPQLARIGYLQESLDILELEQTALTARLNEFPRYRAVSPARVDLISLQQTLGEGEAYAKMIGLSDGIYMLYVTRSEAIAYRADISTDDLEFRAQLLRDSVVQTEGGQTLVNLFDVEGSYELYRQLFAPVHDHLASAEHLIFEPDGGMLQLPPAVLVTSEESVNKYLAKQDDEEVNPFDFTGIDWLGRDRRISIAVSPRGFLELRNLAPSTARRDYLGLGQNAIPTQQIFDSASTEACTWPVNTWGKPISADELYFAAGKFGSGDVMTDEAFTDTALLNSQEINDYRVVHFATHGLVTAPRPGCPPSPALVTSFGQDGSDGLLSFREIFDLNLNADVVILSACDTAGMATAAVSREAGITTGGNFALDGLVRAFVAAGARSVVASHWPVPDDFDATQRLVNAIVGAEPGTALAQSLVNGQADLMDDPQTSHPFYWGAFIILGDGEKQVIAAGG